MPDASSLRATLSRVDGTAPAIQASAAAMMRFYDRSASVAVNEWRNALQTCDTSQLLPLLYVANEVLQNSKRNRGNQFLEAMSPILAQALQHLCSRDRNVVEKVRRTAKIWGDRRVFSIRFVNELLQALEPYRKGNEPPPSKASPAAAPEMVASPGASFSPDPEEQPSPNSEASTRNGSNQNENNNDENNDDDDIENIMNDDDDDIFGGGNNSQKLDLEINLGSALDKMGTKSNANNTSKSSTPNNNKRRRGSLTNENRKQRRILSAGNLLELWTRLADLQQRFEGAQLVLQKIDERVASCPADELSHLVGDELQQAYQQNRMDQKQMALQRRNLHAIAQEKHTLEQEAKRYLPWLETALRQDEDDIEFCDMLDQKIQSFQGIHAIIKKARDDRVAQEKRKEQERKEKEKKRKEKEELERFRRAALAKETEAKPGMVWNPSTREYQYQNTEESWRE